MALNERDSNEAEARTALQAMLPRLADAPHVLLGVPPDATHDVLRSAFLRLTKQYHPTKYARFAPDVVRLANEVFLTIKRAYDQLAPGPRMFAGGTGVRPAVRASGTSPPPIKPGFGPGTRAVTNVGPAPAPPMTRPPPPAARVPRSATAPVPKVSAKDAVPTPIAAQPTRPTVRAAPAPAPSGVPPLSAVAQAQAEFDAAIDLLRRKLWAEARAAFHKLAAAAPSDKRYRAHMHYARGHESLDAGKPEEARAEWQRALALDPDFVRARTALGDLAPPPPSGGLFSRLFKK